MSWPLKYRPKKFEELALKDVREQMQNIFKQDSLPQVFLFAGPKGSGKTSTSRIISSVLNKDLEAIEHEKIFSGNSFIINELDAASNRGIDDVRSLKERVVLPPQYGQKSVYILDEAHMLTREAFNALLKILEEPPQHAVFILATTELHKIPDTIVSRANLIKFRKAQDEELREVLSKILDREKISFDDNALDEVIKRAGGSFRDAVKILETVSKGQKKLSNASLEVLGSLTLQEELKQLVNAVLKKDEKQLVEVINLFRNNGEDEKYVFQNLLDLLHQDLMRALEVEEGSAEFNKRVSLFLLDNLVDLTVDGSSIIPFLSLEVKLLNIIAKAKEKGGGSSSTKVVKKNLPERKKVVPHTVIKADQQEEAEIDIITDIIKPNIKESSPISDFKSDNLVDPNQMDTVDLAEVWDDFLRAIEQQNLTLAAIMKSSKLIPDQNGVNKVGVYYKFHKLQLEQQKQMSILQNCGQEVAGGIPIFEFVIIENDSPQAEVDSSQNLEKDISEALL